MFCLIFGHMWFKKIWVEPAQKDGVICRKMILLKCHFCGREKEAPNG